MLAQLEANFPEDLQVVYRHFPLISIHDKAALAAQAAEAAGNQDKFWDMHDALYSAHAEWSAYTEDEFRAWLESKAADLDLNTGQFMTDLDSEETVNVASQAWDFGAQIGIRQTPYLLINGNPYGGPMDFQNLSAIVKLSALEKRQYDECPPFEIDPLKEYVATIDTEKGQIVLQLFADKSPLAVNNFVFLAREGWYDGVTFHRVVPGFVAQAGDPTGTGMGSPGYAFDNELSAGLNFDRPGILGMANAGPGSNGAQFFITYAPQPDLDGGYTIFGEVLSGMETLDLLTVRVPERGGNWPDGDKILRITIEER